MQDTASELEMIDGKLTTRGAAQVIGVGEEAIRRYIRSGQLVAKKFRVKGRKQVWLITPTDLKAFQLDD